jgi:hypothetical protein
MYVMQGLFSHMAMGRGVGRGDVAEPSEHVEDSKRNGEWIGERIGEIPTVREKPPVDCGHNRRRRQQRARRKFFRQQSGKVGNVKASIWDRVTRLEAQVGTQWRVLEGGGALLDRQTPDERRLEIKEERIAELEREMQELMGGARSLWETQQALARETTQDLGQIRQDSLADRERIAEVGAKVEMGVEDLRQHVRRLEDVAEGAAERGIQAVRVRSVDGGAEPDPEPGELSRWMVETLAGMASDGGMRDGGQESPGESEGETRSSNGEGKQETGDRGAQNTGYWQRFGGTEVISLREARRQVRERKAKWKAEHPRIAALQKNISVKNSF